MILDVSIHDEITDQGPWFTATVYYVVDGWIDNEGQDATGHAQGKGALHTCGGSRRDTPVEPVAVK